jgi:hypothetical protein
MMALLKGLVVLAALVPSVSSQDATNTIPARTDAVSSLTQSPRVSDRKAEQFAGNLPPEVRLRKLHLVRPDLIPYPIAVEVYC